MFFFLYYLTGVVVPIVPLYPVYVVEASNQMTPKEIHKTASPKVPVFLSQKNIPSITPMTFQMPTNRIISQINPNDPPTLIQIPPEINQNIRSSAIPLPINQFLKDRTQNAQPIIVPVTSENVIDLSSLQLKDDFPSTLPKASSIENKHISSEPQINMADCNLWPESLQYSSKAIRAVVMVASDINDVKDYSRTPVLEHYVKNVTDFARDASFHVVLAIGLRGAPVARAIQSTQAAVDAALVGSNIAQRAANEYENKEESAHKKQLVRNSAQRAAETADVAREIMSKVKAILF